MSIENIPQSTEFDNPLATGDEKFQHGGKIRVLVVTPESTLLDELVEFVALPLYDGEIGVMHGRAPLIGRLGYGEMRIKQTGNTRNFFVDGGFAQVRDDVVTILTNRAIEADVLEATVFQDELERAKGTRAVTELELTERTRAVERARGALRVARRKS